MDTKQEKPESKVEKSLFPAVGTKAYIYNPASYFLRDPITGDEFPSYSTVRVAELGAWSLCQLQAGLLSLGVADDVGVKPEKNTNYTKSK